MAKKTVITPENIIIGPATILAGDYGCEDTELTDLGATKDGVTIQPSRTFYDVEADQAIGIIKSQETKRTMTIKTTLLEATLENLGLAWGYGKDALKTEETGGTKTLYLGAVDKIPYQRLQFIGPGPKGQERTFDVHKVRSVGAGEYTFRKDAESGIPVEFEVIVDPTQPQGQEFGKIVDAAPTAPAP